ncbi:MAG: acetyl-CoA carboxylase biotin carboxyl carrier protein [Streptosporangiaceae bacterium]
MDLTNEDVADILALLDSMPYDELDLQTTRFRLTLRRTPDGWSQSTQVLGRAAEAGAGAGTAEAAGAGIGARGPQAPTIGTDSGARGPQAPSIGAGGPHAPMDTGSVGAGEIGEASGVGEEGAESAGELVAVRAPLPGTFYRAPRPGAAPFVEVGSRVGADTVVAIVETMKLMNSVTAGADGTVAEICLANGDFAAHGATLMRIRADP